MKKLLLISSALALIVSFSSCKKDSSDDDSKYYLSFTANGKEYNLDFCAANEFTMNSNDELLYFTKIFGYNESNVESSMIQPPSVVMVFEGNSTGTYNNSDFTGYLYSIVVGLESEDYIFPQTIENVKGNYEINITEYSLSAQKISGTFHGLIYGVSETDSLIIENGKFHGGLYSPPQD